MIISAGERIEEATLYSFGAERFKETKEHIIYRHGVIFITVTKTTKKAGKIVSMKHGKTGDDVPLFVAGHGL